MTKDEKKEQRELKRIFIAMIKKHQQALKNVSLPYNETISQLLKSKKHD